MLAHRIIPTILMKQFQQVKGVGFSADRVVGNALQAARIHAARKVDEILMLDVTATKEGREPYYAMLAELTKTAFTPVTVGGGITKIEHVKKLLDSGADRVSVGFDKYPLIREISEKYGRQCVTCTIDIGRFRCAGYEQTTAIAEAQMVEKYGAGEIILQSIELDGTMLGYNIELIRAVAASVSVPVVASGGCSGYADMENALQAGAQAVAAGALYLFTDATPRLAAEYLHLRNVEVRYELP